MVSDNLLAVVFALILTYYVYLRNPYIIQQHSHLGPVVLQPPDIYRVLLLFVVVFLMIVFSSSVCALMWSVLLHSHNVPIAPLAGFM